MANERLEMDSLLEMKLSMKEVLDVRFSFSSDIGRRKSG